jgi:adenylate kinase
VHSGSGLGQQVKAVMERGELVGDDLIIGIVRERLSRPDALAGFVLDGFPRTAAQARALDDIIQDRGPVICVEMQVPDEELVRRVRSRRVCEDCGANADAFEHKADALPDLCQNTDRCRSLGPKWVARSDDSETVVRERLKIYWRDTRPMIEFYSSRPTFRSIDGKQTPEQVREALVSAVASALGLPAAQLPGLVAKKLNNAPPPGGAR